MEISGNLSTPPFSTGSGKITLKNSLRNHFYFLKSPDLGCSFLDVQVLISRFLLFIKIYVLVLTTRNKSNFENGRYVAIVSWLAKHFAFF